MYTALSKYSIQIILDILRYSFRSQFWLYTCPGKLDKTILPFRSTQPHLPGNFQCSKFCFVFVSVVWTLRFGLTGFFEAHVIFLQEQKEKLLYTYIEIYRESYDNEKEYYFQVIILKQFNFNSFLWEQINSAIITVSILHYHLTRLYQKIIITMCQVLTLIYR